MQKLPVPNITLDTQDQGSAFQTKMNSLASACKTAVEAYNNQVDAAETAQQYSDAAQQALLDADVTPVLRRMNMFTDEMPSISLDFEHADYYGYVQGSGIVTKQLSDLMQTTRDTPVIGRGLAGFESIPANTPIIELDPVKHAVIGLKSAAVRVNKLLKSNDFAASQWIKSGATPTEASTPPPLVGAKVWQLTENATAGGHYIKQDVLLEANKTYSIVVVAKPAERNEIAIQTASTGKWLTPKISTIDLLDATVIDGDGKTARLYDDFVESYITANYGAAAGYGGANIYVSKDGQTSYQGDGVSSVEIFTVDLVEGSIAGPPIITDTVALATAADSHSCAVTHNGSFTIYGEFDLSDYPVDTFVALCRLSDSANTATRGAAIRIGRTLAGNLTAVAAARGADGILTSIPASNQNSIVVGSNKMALSFDSRTQQLSISLNGVTTTGNAESAGFLQTYATHMFPISKVNITSNNTNPETVRCKRCIFWPYLLSAESRNKWTSI
ncbi:phage head spike fiber domain-containing protein [Rheinheimera baltica]|uniref:phage head spike fiber domain-containing protein n=1 Tax=Rheinheimera baltica TaxID=67576 RepID=UPI0004217C53|nr:hypothetical protein [Rheinheimera baltica]